MLIHTVMFRWKADIPADEKRAFAREYARVAAAIPEIRSVRHGHDLRFRETNADYMVVLTFDDEAGWRAYQDHPGHKGFIERHVTPNVAERASAQIAID